MNRKRDLRAFILDKPTKKYLEMLPVFQEKRAQAITTLILTFSACSFFGFFAINPTLSTITHLQKQLEDTRFVDQKLQQKIDNLNALQQEYQILEPDLPLVQSAIPFTPQGILLTAQIAAIAEQSNVTIESLSVTNIALSNTTKGQLYAFFPFTTEVHGTYLDIVTFATTLKSFERIITIDSLTITKTEKSKQVSLAISGKAYVMPEKTEKTH